MDNLTFYSIIGTVALVFLWLYITYLTAKAMGL